MSVFTIPFEERQCWAFNIEGQRCEHPAGHPGNHVVMKEWGDDECYSPTAQQLPTVITTSNPTANTVSVTTVNPEVTKCVGCNHAHKSGPCKCGCYEFIG